MGTRRSRHNKGRSPLYKDHRSVASNLLAHKRYGFFAYKWHDTNCDWHPNDEFKLDILCEAEVDIEGAADALGRKPTALAHHARDIGITLPPLWARLIAYKAKRKWREPSLKLVAPKIVRATPAVAYPYINKPRVEHSDLLAVNAVIPSGIPDHMRADMCQEIMLAILEKRTSLEALKAKNGNATYFIKKFYHDNYEAGGHSISFQDTDDDWNADAVASSIAAKEWQREQFAERTGYTNTLRTFTAPTQFEAAWRDQIGRIQLRQHEIGHFLSAEEVEEMIAEDGR